MRGAVFFDGDGTLVPGTSSSQHLAAHLGHGTELRDAEAQFAAGILSNQQVSAIDARAWRGHAPSEVTEWLETMPLVQGIEDVVTRCESQRLLPVLVTLTWQPVDRYLCDRFGFADCSGPHLEVQHRRHTGAVAADFDKRDYALDLARRAGLTTRRCAAVGDSRSDLPLFERVALSHDLRQILPTLTDWQSQLTG